MARDFIPGSSEYISLASPCVTAAPFSVSAWCKIDETEGGDEHTIIFHSDGTTNQFFNFRVDDVAPTKAQFSARNTSGSPTIGVAETTTTIADGDTFHLGGVTSGPASRKIYLNGTMEHENTTNIAPSGIDQAYIGCVNGSSDFWDGWLAEIALWDDALTDDEMSSLANRASPLLIRPASLIFCARLRAFGPGEADEVGQIGLTLQNTPGQADHPDIIYPASVMMPIVTPAAVGGTTPKGPLGHPLHGALGGPI